MRRAATWLVVLATLLAGCAIGDQGATGSAGYVEVSGIGSTRADVPRPKGVRSAACDADPLPPASDAPVAERLVELRKMGLFADRVDVSDEDLVAEVTAALADQWESVDRVPKPMLDLAIAEQDRTRVWWRDLEADVADGNDVYAQTVAELAEISVGAFEPIDITETWAGESGPVTVAFSSKGKSVTLKPTYLEDWIDPGILVGINDALADPSRRFELYKAFDQTAFVMALTDDERRAFEARGWCFE